MPHAVCQHVFTDSGWAAQVMHIARLKEDYLAPEAYYRRVMVDRKREAPAIFKLGAWYLMLTSGCQGWDPSAAEVFVTRCGAWTMPLIITATTRLLSACNDVVKTDACTSKLVPFMCPSSGARQRHACTADLPCQARAWVTQLL